MQKVIEKAAVLIEALPYIQRFRGETVVVKFGGSIMDDEDGVRAILNDVAFMACVGLRPVLVHGGGKAISERMKERGLRPNFLKGLRVTDEATVEIVEDVLNHRINPHMVEVLEGFGCKARGIHGDDILRVVRHTEADPAGGAAFDWGYVGDVAEVDVEPVKAYLASEIVPLITPLGRGPDRHVYNINADEAASAIARALRARKLVFLSDVPGLLSDPADKSTVISSVRVADVEDLIRRGVIAGGMLPKIGGALNAVKAGVQKTHIIDSALPHSLLLELFTDQGVGTEILG
jgi:acetylglutamate kinase